MHLLRRLSRFSPYGALQCIRFTRMSASVKTISTFSLVWCHNASVSHDCLHLLGRLSRYPWYGVTMHAFQTRCLHLLRLFLPFPGNGVKMHAFHTRVCIDVDDFCVFLGKA